MRISKYKEFLIYIFPQRPEMQGLRGVTTWRTEQGQSSSELED